MAPTKAPLTRREREAEAAADEQFITAAYEKRNAGGVDNGEASKACLLGSAALAAVLPAVLIGGVYNLEFESFWYLFLAVTAASTYFLFAANKKVFRRAYKIEMAPKINVAVLAKKLGVSDAEVHSTRRHNAVRIAISWALFVNNAIFLVTFAFLGLYSLRSVELKYSYPVAATLAAALTWQLSK